MRAFRATVNMAFETYQEVPMDKFVIIDRPKLHRLEDSEECILIPSARVGGSVEEIATFHCINC